MLRTALREAMWAALAAPWLWCSIGAAPFQASAREHEKASMIAAMCAQAEPR
jgi:hypothetical protein|tara:strand:- start:891 stop:1046 length:156 start_codon:yes stop_codon:yes gene_type:complete